MKPEIGKTYIITTDSWFIAPDGKQYRAVYGTVSSINSDKEVLGITTNRGSTNWYVVIGDMIIAGCQIHYCIKSNTYNNSNHKRAIEHNGKMEYHIENQSLIYNANSIIGRS